MSDDTSISLEVLRESGPMDLRDLTRATALRMGWSLRYDDVDGVMRRHLERGQVAVAEAPDWRDSVWRAPSVPEVP